MARANEPIPADIAAAQAGIVVGAKIFDCEEFAAYVVNGDIFIIELDDAVSTVLNGVGRRYIDPPFGGGFIRHQRVRATALEQP